MLGGLVVQLKALLLSVDSLKGGDIGGGSETYHCQRKTTDSSHNTCQKPPFLYYPNNNSFWSINYPIKSSPKPTFLATPSHRP